MAMFGKNWQSAEATILQVHIKKTSGDGLVSIREFAAEVRPGSGDVFRAKIDEPRWTMDFFPPSVRDVVKVEFDAKSGTVRFDMSDPTLSFKAHEKAEKDAFAASLRNPSPTPTASAPRPGATITAEQLQNLFGAATMVSPDSDAQAAALREMILRATGIQQTESGDRSTPLG